MSLWRRVSRGVSALVHRASADRDIADEVEHYFQEAVDALEAGGLSPEEAQRRARQELGSAVLVREEVRSFGWENTVSTTLGDLRYAARRLRQSPGFTAVAVLTLALGIGASAAIFSAVNPILFAPLPYPHADRVMAVWESGQDGSRSYPAFGTYFGLAERTRSFEALAALKPWQPTLLGAREPERLDGQRVSAPFFRVLGVAPAVGRDFHAFDDRPRGPNVVLLSNALWRRRFAADRSIVGRQIRLDDRSYTVVGVMPAGFENVLSSSAELWAPLQYDPSLPSDGREWGHHLRIVGRLRPGIDPRQAASESDAILALLARLYAKGYDSSGGPPRALVLTGLQQDMAREVRPALLAIAGAVLLLLLIACVNVTSLLLARGAQRRGELAVRLALGASRGRLVRQMLTESLLLSVVGGALGLAVALAGLRALVSLAPTELPRTGAMHLDFAVLGFAVVVTTAVGLAVGLVPALQGSRGDPQARLRASSRRSTGGHSRARRTLVVSEVALALVLLVGAGLLERSLHRLFSVAPGFRPDRLLTLQVQISGRQFDADEAAHRFFARALEEVRRVPGVLAAAWTSQLPLSGDYDTYGVRFEEDDRQMAAYRYVVSPGYCETMGIPLRRGRMLEPHDDLPSAPTSVLISESLARKEFGSRDPLGKRLRCGPPASAWETVVGVVGDVRQLSLAVSDAEALYVAPERWPWAERAMSLVVRSRADAASLASPVRRAIWSVDKDQPIVRVATMGSLVAATESERRFVLILFEAFAAVALALATIGIYGILSGSVAERLREIGVRAALGASRGNLVGLVTRQGLTLTALGIAGGLAGAAVASRAIVTLLFDVSRLDPVTYGGVVAVLLAVSGIACAIPAWRAARVDPAVTLRAE